jgi:hypothetical protein
MHSKYPGNGTTVPPRCSRGILESCAVVRRVVGSDEESAGRMLERRELVESDPLRDLPIPMEQSPVIFSGPCSRAAEIDERALCNR